MTNQENVKKSTVVFDSVVFDKESKTMTILNGTEGTYPYTDIIRCAVLNEKAKTHGTGEPFTALVPNGPLPVGMMSEPAIYTGLKVTMANQKILAIYISKTPTHINTDQHIADRKEAEQIKHFIDTAIRKYHPEVNE